MHGDDICPAAAGVAVLAVAIVVREEYELLQFARLQQQFKPGRADVAVVLGVFVAPGVVAEAAERHYETDQRNRVAADLVI